MREIRTIIFDHDELKVAIEEYQQRSRTHFPKGSIKSLAVSDGPPTVRLNIAGPTGPDRILTLSADDILSALIEFCITHKVRLPIRSTKRIEVVEGAASLVITIGSNRPNSATALGTSNALVYRDGNWTFA